MLERSSITEEKMRSKNVAKTRLTSRRRKPKFRRKPMAVIQIDPNRSWMLYDAFVQLSAIRKEYGTVQQFYRTRPKLRAIPKFVLPARLKAGEGTPPVILNRR